MKFPRSLTTSSVCLVALISPLVSATGEGPQMLGLQSDGGAAGAPGNPPVAPPVVVTAPGAVGMPPNVSDPAQLQGSPQGPQVPPAFAGLTVPPPQSEQQGQPEQQGQQNRQGWSGQQPPQGQHGRQGWPGRQQYRVLADEIEAVRQSLYQYPFALDTKDLSLLDPLFTPNATYSIPITFGTVTGLAAIKEKINEATPSTAKTQHVFSGDVIAVNQTAGTAAARVYLKAELLLQNTTEPISFRGYFTDKLVRLADGRYAFSDRVFTSFGF